MLEVVYESTWVHCKTLRALFDANAIGHAGMESAQMTMNQRFDTFGRLSLFSDNADFSISFEGRQFNFFEARDLTIQAHLFQQVVFRDF
jgi:hypothetical protein